MERKEFLSWSSQVDRLSEAQKLEPGELLAGRPVGEASVAAVEMSVGEDRTCPRCGTGGAKANGKARGLQRYLCQSCNRTCQNDDGQANEWPAPQGSLADIQRMSRQWRYDQNGGEAMWQSYKYLFRWRHRFLAGINTGTDKLKGIVEADETWFPRAVKGTVSGTGRKR